MNKTKKIFIMLIMIYMICTTFVTSFAKNETNYEGKGTVSLLSVDKDGKELDKSTWGTAENPYQLVLGEPIIDIYYGDYADAKENGGIHFEFTSGKYNAANYIVENNVDKGRLRLKLQGTTDDYLKVTPQQGLDYLQAGGVAYFPDYFKKDNNDKNVAGTDEKINEELEEIDKDREDWMLHDEDKNEQYDVTVPYYSIIANEYLTGIDFVGSNVTLEKEQALANAYLITGDTMISNLATYGTAYVFSQSNVNINEAYKFSDKQNEKINELGFNFVLIEGNNFLPTGEGYFIDADINKIEFFKSSWENMELDDEKQVMVAGRTLEGFCENLNFERVVYCFEGTNSEILDMDRETPPIESVLSKLCLSIIDGITKVAKLGGKDGKYYVTIDSLVFNEYPNTIVDFWGGTNYLNGKAKPMINFWFNVFKAWAIAMYIFLLIYIGIKTMIVSGTSEQKKVKSMFEGWLIGVLMMFCFPFLFKYLIVINDMVVDIIRTNSKYSVYAYYTFENMYTKWGQEDGENSTTSVIDRLRKAAEQLKQDIADKNTDVDEKQKEIEELENEIASKEEKINQGRQDILSFFANPASRNNRCTVNKYRD